MKKNACYKTTHGKFNLSFWMSMELIKKNEVICKMMFTNTHTIKKSLLWKHF